ncbi:leucine-rich repeat-containing protein 56 isoform X2 [Canis lupus familiaris]|uniref:leucine-rich repeat-containing protein 56 isoform X2 n=2 Tax=Canis lupus TaxID=9612 RepID=UPI0006B3CEB7|nr:leucine-rich repeat-containing protein 56 isoform X2 [Canis lupus familiaris]XP_038418871.1 leucine-rich repeat-containing protein 56 isoform X2 [Canis lupus familiaris]|eukprot:XP_022260992.1 leucine-rich repeat-containing protein 56 isoform X2 [Canis lupus familiaris]
MDQACNRAHGPWPGTAAVRVRELGWQGPYNPRPQSKDPGSRRDSHGERLVQEYLSPARLRALAQVDDLGLVNMLEMCVNTRENSLGNFGKHLPKLSQLKLNGSCLGSVRDLGTSLGCLQVLWLARCGLTDLDGVGSFLALKELYVSYNNISDLSPLCLLEELEVLDLEGNSVDDLGQVRYLQLCPRLATLTLEGNLVCLRPGPSPSSKLQVLDEVPAAHTGLPASWKLDQDWLMVKEAIKEAGVFDGLLPGLDHPHGANIQRLSSELFLPDTQPRAPRPWPLSLLVPGGPLPESLLPRDPAPEDDSSNLTHGAGRVLCGNPTKGLRERRHQCQAWAAPEPLPPHRLEDSAMSASIPGPDQTDSSGDLLALARLPAHRELGLWSLESQQEGATASGGPRRSPEEQEDKSRPKTPSGPPCLAPEPFRTLGCNLIPCPPKMPSDSSHSSWGATGLQFQRRRLRALCSLGPGLGQGAGLGQGLAAGTALRALEVTSGPSPRAQGCPGPKAAPDSAARVPGLRRMLHLNPITPAQAPP